MTAAGCPARDHDGNSQTADQASCIGYELIADISPGNHRISGTYTAKLVGNGFRILNPTGSAANWAPIQTLGWSGSIEGIGVVNPQATGTTLNKGGLVSELQGTAIGVYVEGGSVSGGTTGGLAGTVANHATSGAGLVAHSYVRGTTVGHSSGTIVGGLAGNWGSADTNANTATCVNSYFSGTVTRSSSGGLIGGQNQFNRSTFTNCVGDTSTDTDDSALGTNNVSGLTATKAQMIAVTDYDTPATNNPFANWDDYDAAGTALASGVDRTDFWYFGDSTTFPVLKGWGHDRTEAMARSLSGSQTVNLCTRTLAVANEIIRLLKDNDRAPGVTTTPAAVTALTDCTASTDTRNVSITNLANLVVTSETNPFNLNPDRTDPASAKLTALDMNDFAYLTNATHFNLSGNSLTTLPPRLFQGVPLRWLDLSDNQLTTIPADLFAGLGTVTATTDNMLFLNGNSLTYTGIADRVFDPLTHLNGLDLSDNSLTRVNTRWFEKLVNLGRRPATGASFRPKLGLHMSGNIVTHHFYSTKLSTGVTDDVVDWAGIVTGPGRLIAPGIALTGPGVLRSAIVHAITEAAGGTTPTTLDIDSTEHFDNTATPPAYLGSDDGCPLDATAGPAGYAYFGDDPPDCYIVPKWSPPNNTGINTPGSGLWRVTTVGYASVISVNIEHRGHDWFDYQIRYRRTPGTPSDPWTQDWQLLTITKYGGMKTAMITGLTGGTSYQVQVRALESGRLPAGAVTSTVTTLTAPTAPTGLSAVTSTTTTSAIELSWTKFTIDPGTEEKYQVRHKLSSAQTYGAWQDITGSNYQTDYYTLTGLTPSSEYDVQLRFHWSDTVGASAASTTSATASGATVTGVPLAPRNFKAVPGTDPGTIDLSWTASPGATGYQISCADPCTRTTVGTVTTHTMTIFQDGSFENTIRDVFLYLYAITATSRSPEAVAWSDPPIQPPPRITEIEARYIDPPGSIYISWASPSRGIVTRYEYAYDEGIFVPDYPTWHTVPDSDGDDDLSDEREYTITGLRPNTVYVVMIRVLTDAGYSPGHSEAVPWWFFQTQRTLGRVPLLGVSASPSETTVGAIRVVWGQQDTQAVRDTVNEYRYQRQEYRYQVRYKLASSSWPSAAPHGWTDVADGPDTGSHTYDESGITIAGLTSGQRYDIELRSNRGNYFGATSVVKIDAKASRVPVPTDFNANPGSETGEVDLSWNAITGATGYQYRCNPAGTGCTNTWTTAGTGTTHTVTGLTGGESYSMELRAITATEQSTAATATSAAQTLPGPQNFAAAQGTAAGEIDLSWSAPSSGTVTHYEYRFKLASNASYPTSGTGAWAQVPDGSDSGTSRADETGFTIASLRGGMSYNIQLRVLTAAGYSLPSTATSEATPRTAAAPATFDAVIGTDPGTIDLTWTAIPSTALPTNHSVVNYQYRTKLMSAGASTYTTWTNLAGGANTTSYTVTGLSTNTLYDIQLRAAIDDGDDQDSVADYHSRVATDTSVLSGIAIPADLRATVGSDPGEVDLNWTAQTAFGPSFTSAKYQYRTKLTSANWPSGGGWTDIPSSNYGTDSHALEGLAAGQRHDIELRFLATSSIISAAATAQVSLSSPSSAVPVPQNVVAVPSTTAARAIDVSWSAQTDTTSQDAKYQVRYKRTSASWQSSSPYGWTDVTDGPDRGSDTHDEIDVTITGLVAGRDYDIELRFNWSDDAGVSNAVKVVARASRVPAPTGFDARTGSAPGEIDLSWNAVTGATRYEYRCNLAAPPGCSTSWSTAGTGTSHTITGLNRGTFHNIQLRAIVLGEGASPATAYVRAQAQSATPGPASLTFSHGPNPGDLKIDWTAPCCGAPVTHYEYRYKRETESNSAYTAWQTVPDSSDPGTSKADEITTTITGLRASTGSPPLRQEISYHVEFRVYASSSIGHSVPQRGTQTAKQVPPPTHLTCRANAIPGEVRLWWSAPGGVNVHFYVIDRRIGNLPWSDIAEVVTDATSFTFDSYKRLRAGVRYTFRVRTIMTVGGSAPSRSVSCVTKQVPTPSYLRARTGRLPGELNVSWSRVPFATGYEYRYYRSGTSPAASRWHPVSSRRTSKHFSGLDEGQSYVIDVRAVVRNVGKSGISSGQATARGSSFPDWLGLQSIPSSYEVAPAPEAPGRIAIRIPRAFAPNPFIFRHRTANPGQWSRWFTVRPEANQEQYLIPDLQVGVRYEVQVREYTGPETGFTTALSQEVEATPLEVPEGFKVTESSGIIKLEWASPELYTPDSYEYRSLPAGATTWSDWITVQHQGDRGTTQTLYVPDLQSGVEYQFELRVVTTAGNGPVASVRVTTRVSLPEINAIRPEVREVTLRAGDAIRLGVDVYNQQDGLDNSIPGKTSSQLVFRWSEVDAGGGSFADPGDGRRVVYTAPSSPGTYTITAEAQPDGICKTHHADASGISDANRAPCIATFTIRVTGAAGVADPQPVPVNPAGVIPTELTDNAGTTYTVFTPVDGGTFTGSGFTVSAPAGAVLDRTLLGVTAAVSTVPVPAPVPGASMSLAGSFYDINAIQQSGQEPLTAYSLDDALHVCLPFPQEFRADLSNVVVVQRQSDGNLSLLTTKVRSNAGTLTVCGAVSTLPATVGVAKLGLVQPVPATPAPEEDTPDTGATAPSYTLTLLMLLTGLVILAGIILHIPVSPRPGAPSRASSAS